MIELSNIANTLGENAVLSICANSNAINKWSLYKPINTNKIKWLDDEDFQAVNYGFNLYSYTTALEMIADLNDDQSDIWAYIERQAPFRLTDFQGYSHEASPLLSPFWLNKDTGKAGDTIKFCVEDETATIVNNWQFYVNALSNYDYCFIIYPATSTGGGVWIYKIINKLDYESNGRFALKIPTSLTDGDYTAVLCVTNATLSMSVGEVAYDREGDYIGVWCPFPPHTKLNFTVSSSGSGGGGGGEGGTDYFTSIDFTYTYMDFNYNHGTRTIDDLSFEVKADLMASQGTYSVALTAYYDNAPSSVNIGTQYVTLTTSSPSQLLTFNYRDTIYPIVEAQLEDNIINIRFEAEITYLSQSQTKSWSANLEKEIK